MYSTPSSRLIVLVIYSIINAYLEYLLADRFTFLRNFIVWNES